MLVAEVRKDGAAAKAGVLAGDMIVSIAGQPIRNMTSYMAVMTQQRRGRALLWDKQPVDLDYAFRDIGEGGRE